MAANIYARRSYEKHKPERIQKAMEYQKSNPEITKKARKTYYEKNKTEILAKNREWYRKNKKHRQDYKKRVGRAQALKCKYGITLEQFQALLASQDNKCAICRNPFANSKDAHVDHCHKTQLVRGVLCYRCNHGLGKFLDNPTFLESAASYVRKHGGK